jgi:DNA-directed RNA polymerase specialized sigma24 family protein
MRALPRGQPGGVTLCPPRAARTRYHRAVPAAFPTTRWTLVAAAGGADRERALQELLRAYWEPVYVYVRRKGLGPEDAADAVQDLFAELVAKDFPAKLDPDKGLLRGWLRACADHRLAHRRERAGAKKRAAEVVPFDADVAERAVASSADDPERAFQRAWAARVMDRAMARLRGEFDRGERTGDFALVSRFFGADEPPAYREAAAAAGMSLPQLKSFLHRARLRYRELVLDEVRDTVADAAEAERELAELLA